MKIKAGRVKDYVSDRAFEGTRPISTALLKALEASYRTKYGNKKTVVDGITFDSKGEAARWQELCLLKKAGKIHALLRQFRYPLKVNGVLITTYVADFVYSTPSLPPPHPPATIVVEDFKGHRTKEYRIKKKLFEALYSPLTITEVGRRKRRK